MFDNLVGLKVHGCRNKYFGDDAGMKETVKSMTRERAANIADYFDLDIDVEILIEKLDE